MLLHYNFTRRLEIKKFNPVLYNCNSDSLVTLISVLAGAKRTSPSNDPACIIPSPAIMRKMEGPETAEKTVDASWGKNTAIDLKLIKLIQQVPCYI